MNSDNYKKCIINAFREKNNSHAFLVNTNNINKCFEDIKDIIKEISCPDNLDKDKFYNSIDNEENPDILIVRPDGKEIKASQVNVILDRFITKPLLSKYSIYIIDNADAMNISASNKLLKFLEEPEEKIVGFFITDKINKILPTIRSRCELYNFIYNQLNLLDVLNVTEEEFGKYYNLCIDFSNLLSSLKDYELMARVKDYSKYERNEILFLLRMLYNFYVIKYENIMYLKYNNNEIFSEILSSINTQDLKIIVKRLKLLDNSINNLNINVNKDLFFNNFFVDWSS